MAIFSRMIDLLKANVNDLIDKAEDPEKMLKQIIIDMEEQLQKATQGLGQVMASQRQMHKQVENAQAQSKLWEDRARMTLKSGNKDLARQAVDNKLKADESVKQYEKMELDISTQVNTVRDQVNTLKMKLEEARTKQSMLVARARVADARKGVTSTIGSVDSTGAFSKMDKMEQKIAEKEAQADAASEISGLNAGQDDPFAALEKQSAADEELARLMEEMSEK